MRTSKFNNVPGLAKDSASSGRRLLLGAALGAGLVVFGLAGCHSNPASTTDTSAAASDPNAVDPTAANSAPVDNSTQVAGAQQQAQPSEQGYTPAAPIERRRPSSSNDQGASDQSYDNGSQDNSAEQGYNATLSDIQAPQPPPPLPEYSQPPDPDPNYIWTPGYWSYAPTGYYWVPGAWTEPPYTGALWTPGYWGGDGPGYRFHHGFWAAHIGFYGGINYGFGYVGTGYQGGYWNGPHFFYNQYANNININVNPGFREAVYQRDVRVNNEVINNRVVNNTTITNVTVNNTHINNVSYNGGRGGVQAAPRPAELAVLREQRVPPMQAQVQARTVAAKNPQQFFAKNQGHPAEVAAARPLVADRGIPAPAHTTAEINRSAPAAEQQRQHQEAFKQAVAPQARPAGAPVAAEPNRPVSGEAARPGMPQSRPGVATQPARPETQARPAPAPIQNHPAAQPQAHPQPQPQARPQQEVRPQPKAKPAPQAHPQPEARPAPQAHPQPEARPAPQARPQPEARPAPQAHPQPAKPQPHPQEEKKPEPHA